MSLHHISGQRVISSGRVGVHAQEPDPGDNGEDGVCGGDADGVDEREDAGSRKCDGELAHGTGQEQEVSKMH